MLEKFSANLKASMKVLVIDDVPHMRLIIIKMLAQLGLTNITEASDGEEGLALIKSNEFSMILCDWNMPKLNGISLLRMIRLSHSTATLPFIMVTSNKNLSDVKDCIVSGVSGFLLKPFSVEGLEKELNDRYDNVLLHQRTLGLLNAEILNALAAQTKLDEK